jgi:hypothetical protein
VSDSLPPFLYHHLLQFLLSYSLSILHSLFIPIHDHYHTPGTKFGGPLAFANPYHSRFGHASARFTKLQTQQLNSTSSSCAMKENILVAVLLVVGLLTPVFGWLFYCWFKSHLTDQHQEGQVFYRRSRDRAQANWRHENGNERSATVGPHFTDSGWVRPKPYGETRVLPLSQ